MANILVTGGTGNIGMYAVLRFIEAGHFVLVLDQHGVSEFLHARAPDVPIVVGDILDFERLRSLMIDHRITHVLHLASMLGVDSMKDPLKTIEVNCRGTANIFDAALASNVERVCWTSSIAALGVMPDYDGRLVDENYRVAPTTPYGASKYYSELVTAIYRSTRELDITCVRPVCAFGLGKLTGSWVANYNRVIYNVAVGRSSRMPRWSSRGLQFIYNRDQATLCVLATLSPRTENWLFNTPTDMPYSEEAFIDTIKAIVPDAAIVIDPTPAFGSAFPPNVDGSRARRELGFEPQYTMVGAMREMIEHYREFPNQGL